MHTILAKTQSLIKPMQICLRRHGITTGGRSLGGTHRCGKYEK